MAFQAYVEFEVASNMDCSSISGNSFTCSISSALLALHLDPFECVHNLEPSIPPQATIKSRFSLNSGKGRHVHATSSPSIISIPACTKGPDT